MTQDYKNLLLDYLTNNLVEETPINDIPEFTNTINDESNLYRTLSNEFTYGFKERGIIKCKDSNNNYNGKTIVYGFYYLSASPQTISNSRGFILLLDENYNMLELITEYSSGTKLGYILALNVDETGQLYGVDIAYNDDNKGRFIMLNNVSIKSENAEHYQVKLRRSYFLQGSVSSGISFIRYIFKDPNSSSYFIYATGTRGTLLKLKVGAENEWIDYTENSTGGVSILAGINAFWDSNNNLTLCLVRRVLIEATNTVYIYLGISDNNNVVQYTNIGEFKSTFYPSINASKVYLLEDNLGDASSRTLRTTSAYIVSPTKFYMTTGAFIEGTGTLVPDKLIPSTIEYDNGTITRIGVDLNYATAEASEDYVIMFSETKVINNALFVINYINEDNTIHYPKYDITVNLMLGEYDYARKFITNVLDSDLLEFNIIDITNMYNLFKVNAVVNSFDAGTSLLFNTNIIYNPNNFNGEAYSNTNAIDPKQIWLYDENGNIIFARNLYNKTLYNNVMEATLEVPNTMLNDITISTQKLISETNYIMNENEGDITKNIYETLYINFFNTILIQNQNTIDYVDNIIGSTRLNRSISDTNDYDEAKITKFRINYQNGTSYVKNIISSTITNGIADIQFQLTPISDILNIEIISNDEETTYQTIREFTNYEIGKTYILSQKCYVE